MSLKLESEEKCTEIIESKKKEGWREIPQELIINSKATKSTIEMLKFMLKIQEGKYVYNTKGLNFFKHQFFGYVLVENKPIS